MSTSYRWLLLLLLSPALGQTAPDEGEGSLVIVGGALKASNAAVYRAFIERLPSQGAVVIVPAASGQPARSASAVTGALQQHGLAASRIVTYALALRDDAGTPAVDESDWADGAWNEEAVAAVANAAGFWFTGGDQMRITRLLFDADGGSSPLLQVLRERLAEGAVIAGSSAGAAIMSRSMISGGDSFRALVAPDLVAYEAIEDQDSGHLSLSKGLGFLPQGLVDQHFDRKARLGRLVRALAASGENLGYGVDEDTALVVDLATGLGRVVGSASVTLLDASSSAFDWQGSVRARGLRLGIAHHGVEFDMRTHTLGTGVGASTLEDPYYGYEPLNGGGMAFANPGLGEMLGHDLLDNRASSQLDRLSVDDQGNALVYRFIQTPGSRGYWLSGERGERYSASGVRFDILYRAPLHRRPATDTEHAPAGSP